MENVFYYWLIFGLLFLLLEIGHSGLFFFFSFFAGAVGAALSSLLDASLYHQIGIFFIISAISFVVLWKKIKGYNTLGHANKTNVFALQGKRAVVVEEIKPLHQGLIKINGEFWSAKTCDNDHYLIGTVVEVINVVGCHCVVRLVNSQNN